MMPRHSVGQLRFRAINTISYRRAISTMTEDQLSFDRRHIWHPYSSMINPPAMTPVVSAQGVHLELADGRRLIDGMSSWWSTIHGYNHPRLKRALHEQVDKMPHVMFGGITHEPAVELSRKLVELTPEGLDCVFLADSGSVSVEVAMKMSLQYWQARRQPNKHRLVALRHGYHGDTFGAMSVCDPVTGMHHLFASVLPQQHFVPRPQTRFHEKQLRMNDMFALRETLEKYHDEIAAFILEPIVQGAGGMYFYSPEYLHQARQLCDEFDVLLIADEIATGFGRTGRLFACEHANMTPDIMCVGKALTGGCMTLAAAITTRHIGEAISQGGAGCFMHGPTFMGNPLACAVANESISLLLDTDWQSQVTRIEEHLRNGLRPAKALEFVADVRCLGAIGVIELHEPVVTKDIQPKFVEAGVWIRPFGKLVYLMPPFVMSNEDLTTLCSSMVQVLSEYEKESLPAKHFEISNHGTCV